MNKLEIPNDILRQITEQAIAQVPLEVCGILAGKNSTAEKLYKMKNTDKSCVHYMMEPQEQFKVAKDIRAQGLKMLAIYHSHPKTPARPSAEDIRMALTPDVIYVIVSLEKENHPVTKGFIIENDNVTEIPIQIKIEQK